MRLSTVLALPSLALFTLVACSGTSTGTSTSSGGTSGSGNGNTVVTPADCSPACNSKATQCGESAAQASAQCSSLCASTTSQQLNCLQSKTCDELKANPDLNVTCPKGDVGSSSGSSGATSGGTSGGNSNLLPLGSSCTCKNSDGTAPSSSEEGLCADSTVGPCAAGLSCIYGMGSAGSGTCFAESCCDMTTACDANKSLLKACSTGSCQKTALGYYCGK